VCRDQCQRRQALIHALPEAAEDGGGQRVLVGRRKERLGRRASQLSRDVDRLPRAVHTAVVLEARHLRSEARDDDQSGLIFINLYVVKIHPLTRLGKQSARARAAAGAAAAPPPRPGFGRSRSARRCPGPPPKRPASAHPVPPALVRLPPWRPRLQLPLRVSKGDRHRLLG
jgi:hypothetical protein